MADTDKVSLAYEEETVEGTVNDTPATTLARLTGESLKQNTTTQIPDELDPAAQIATAPVRTDVSAGGDINYLLSHATYNDFIEATYRSTWSAAVVVEAASALIAATNSTTLTLSAGAWDNTPVVGSWIEVSGFDGQTETVMYTRVSAATTTTITSAFAIFTAEAEGDSVTITQLARVTNGTTERAFTLEKKYLDADGAGTDEYAQYVGSVFGGMTLNAAIQASMAGSFSVLSRTEISASSPLDATPTAAPTGEPYSTVSDVPFVLESTAAITTATELNSTVTNNLRSEPAIGSLGAHRVGRGRFEASGTLKRYMLSEALIDKYLNYTTSGLALVCVNSDGATIFDYPSVKYTDGQRLAGGPNQSVLTELTWQAFKDATLGFSSQVAKTA